MYVARKRICASRLLGDVAKRAHFTRRAAHNSPGRVTLGIRREDPQRTWERRCPLTPDAVECLIREEKVEVLVQPCERRVFSVEEFTKVRSSCLDALPVIHI